MNPAAPVYEDLLDQFPEWALNEGGMHFEEKSAVYKTMRKIAQRLEQLGVSYAIVGGMAMFLHGFRRFTEDVDILVTAEGLKTIHQELGGRGYLPVFQGSKNLRDAEHGVRVEFLVTGQFPGDGKPKPVAFPDPTAVHDDRSGIHVLPLRQLVELKLASGSTDPSRLRDLADVQDLIRELSLPIDLADQLDPSVRNHYRKLWASVRGTQPDV